MLDISERSGVRLIQLDHGKVNALDLELLGALIDAFADAADGEPIVLTGAGRAFSAGVDLRRIVDGDDDYIREFLVALSECFLAVFDHPGPVVAAVNGAAIAGGCVIAAACDRRVMSQGPIGLAELTVGVPFPTSALEIVRSLLGPRTHDLVLTARNVDAQEAFAIGLADVITTPDQLLTEAIAQAEVLNSMPPGVFAHSKRQLHGPARERIAARGPIDDVVMTELWASAGVHTAIAEYLARLAARGSGS